MSTTTVKRKVVGVDTYLWSTPNPDDPKGRRDRHTAERGDVIEISSDEASRGENIIDPKYGPALGAEDAVLPVVDGDFVPLNDDALGAMSVAEVTAYLSSVPEAQSNDEITRVVELEQLRDKPRAGVLALGEDLDLDDDDLQS